MCQLGSDRRLSGDTDKPDGYLREYERAFASIVDREIKLLELGVAEGGSLRMWRDFFPRGCVVGLDVNAFDVHDPSGRIRTYVGPQEDTDLLSKIADEQAPAGFDVIIDDCSHVGELTRTSFWHLFKRHLRPGGIYAIEDWGTGYWSGHPYYPDGRRTSSNPKGIESGGGGSPREAGLHWLAQRTTLWRSSILRGFVNRHRYLSRLGSHDRGMVGFVKQLIDEIGMMDITNPEWGRPPQRPSRIARMEISPGLVIVFKGEQ